METKLPSKWEHIPKNCAKAVFLASKKLFLGVTFFFAVQNLKCKKQKCSKHQIRKFKKGIGQCLNSLLNF